MGHDKRNRIGEMRDVQRMPHSIPAADTQGGALPTHHRNIMTDISCAVWHAEQQYVARVGPASEVLSCLGCLAFTVWGSVRSTACCTQHLCAKLEGPPCALACGTVRRSGLPSCRPDYAAGRAYEVRSVRPLPSLDGCAYPRSCRS